MNATQPTPVPFRDLAPALLAAAAMLLLVYLVQFDQGAVSQTGTFLHELVHDARHLLGVPCH
jgi:hypothetical protein